MSEPARLLRFHAAGAEVLAALPAPVLTDLAPVYPHEPVEDGTADLAVRAVPGGWEIDGGPLGRWQVESIGELRARFEWVLTETFLARLDGVVQVHACGVVCDGAAALVLGAAGAGKSSIALRWCAGGLSVLGDDVVMVTADGNARPFPRLFKVDPARLRDAGVHPVDTPFWVPDATEAWFDPAASGGWADPAVVRLVLLADRTAERSAGFTRMPRSDALRVLMGARFPGGMRGVPAFEALACAVEQAECGRLTFPDAGHAVRLIRDRLA